jgi:hypothetical protein
MQFLQNVHFSFAYLFDFICLASIYSCRPYLQLLCYHSSFIYLWLIGIIGLFFGVRLRSRHTKGPGLGLVLGLESTGLGLGLGLESPGLGLGLGILAFTTSLDLSAVCL